ncbi:cytosolic sulfotransferase 12-like [Salvia hispanica]|uniref:cytosolic sulfotransferase 12-like n=1 Tax=Salvia hispanica TaxID=49212 RepID=UPI002009AC92|nr:cytosolic sulfotransferase 12-like [Salvia hispanica]
MASEQTSRKYLQQEECVEYEIKELISTLPRQNGWLASSLYQYQGFWHAAAYLQGLISCQNHFQARDSDVFLITTPKSGTTWLKALIFALMNRKQNPISSATHPLLSHNPHALVPFLEIKLYADNQKPDIASLPSPRLFSTHIPYVSLPESVKNGSRCKLVYLCRNPKDTFVSLWHFTNKLRTPEMGANDIGGVFDRFCNGISLYGPFWDHVLEYWNLSKDDPEGALFLRYEDMKEQPGVHLRQLAEFLKCPFTAEEDELGLVEEMLRLCSFDHLSGLEVNKSGKLSSGEANNAFFRRGEVGDWKNYLTPEMVDQVDRITANKFSGSGLQLW